MSETLSVHDAGVIAMLRVIAKHAHQRSKRRKVSMQVAVEKEVVRRGGHQLRKPLDPLMFYLAESHRMELAYQIFRNEYAVAIEFLLFVVNTAPEGQFIKTSEIVLKQLRIELPKWRAALEHARELATQQKF